MPMLFQLYGAVPPERCVEHSCTREFPKLLKERFVRNIIFPQVRVRLIRILILYRVSLSTGLIHMNADDTHYYDNDRQTFFFS